MKYYNLLRAWHVRDDNDFRFVNSHDKAAAVRDGSRRETLRRTLVERLGDSKNVILILGATTRFDTDWVPFEISHAIHLLNNAANAGVRIRSHFRSVSQWSTY
jgi:hypothetical protein